MHNVQYLMKGLFKGKILSTARTTIRIEPLLISRGFTIWFLFKYKVQNKYLW